MPLHSLRGKRSNCFKMATASVYFGGTQFYLGDVIGKTLIVKKNVPILKHAYDGSPSIGYVKAGNPAGVVYSYLEPNPSYGRSQVFWIFEQNYTYYYIKHDPTAFDVSALKREGVLTVDEKVQQELEKQQELENASKSWIDRLFGAGDGSLFGGVANVLKYAAIAAVAYYGYKAIKNK